MVQKFDLTPITITTSILGMLGPLLIFFLYWYYPKHRNPTHQVILQLAISNFINGLCKSWATSPFGHSGWCKLQAFLVLYADLTGILWSSMIAFQVLLVVNLERNIKELKRYHKIFHVICWGVPFIPSVIVAAVSTESRGPIAGKADTWCFIASSWGELRLAFLYVPLWVVFLIVLGALAMIARKIYYVEKEMNTIANNKAKNRKRKKLARFGKVAGVYLSLYILIWIWNTINRLNQFVNNETIFGLSVLQAIFSPIWGFTNGIVYGAFTFRRVYLNSKKSTSGSSLDDRVTSGSTSKMTKEQGSSSAYFSQSEAPAEVKIESSPTSNTNEENNNNDV